MQGPARTVPSRLRRHSQIRLACWVFAVLALGLLGSRIAQRLSPMSLEVPGTPSARAEATLRAKFGNTIPIAILLRGPPSQVQREGRALAAKLRTLRGTQTLSPWQGSPKTPSGRSATMLSALQPRPGAAFLLVDFRRPPSAAMATVASTEALLAQTVRAPVHGYITGIAVIGRAIQAQTLKDTERAEMIALPILIIVLLLVFRSPIAAAVPLATGAATVIAGRGLLWLASFVTPVNSLGVAIAAMMSLALGVDYALLMVSRVRQELREGHTHQAAVQIASHAAGRTIIAAGGTLALTMLAASAVATPGLLGPVAIGVVISGLLSVALALSAMPALLLLVGPRLNRFELRLPTRRGDRPRAGVSALAERLIAHPALTAPVILVAMLMLAAPTGALRMGPPDASELPSSSPARKAVQMVQRTIGAGWTAPFVVTATARQGAITTPQRIRALMRWQEQIARQPGVAAVLGPASVAGAKAKLAEAHADFASAPRRLHGAQHSLLRLSNGLRSASAGIASLREGLVSAATGAQSLHAGAGASLRGASRLAQGGEQAAQGARRLARQGGRAQRGAQRLARETGRARAGARHMQAGLTEAAAGSQRLANGLDEAAAGAQGLTAGDERLSAGASRLAVGIDALDSTVHAILAPIGLLAGQLQSWARWLQALQISDTQLRERVAGAIQDLRSIPLPAGDPHAQALAEELQAIERQLESGGLSQLSAIRQALCKGLEELASLPGELAALTASIDRLANGADEVATGAQESEHGAQALDAALHRLATGAHSLGDGLSRLSGGAGGLSNGLRRLDAGGHRLAGGLRDLGAGDRRLAGGLRDLGAGDRRLAGGLGKLSTGAGELEAGLAGAGAKTAPLATGLTSAQRPIGSYQRMLGGYAHAYALLRAESPQALDSGYLVLTALDGTVSGTREQVAQMVNVDSGGQTARMMVVSAGAPSSPTTVALSARLRRMLPSLAAKAGATVQIGQGAQYLLDYRNANTARFPWLVLALAIVATLTLIVVLRALLLPAIAVVLNLATIFVALGALQLLTQWGLLGGPGYIDAASGAGIIAIMFVLSIDYEVFLLTRMRERWAQSADHHAAIAYGLRHTAGVIAGSAAIMTAVFLAFAGAAVVPLRQFGVGLTFAVLLDATIVRLVLLPAVMRLAGPRVWWMPAWLDRRLPALE